MSQFLQYTTVDNLIQNRMGSQAPGESKRIEQVQSIMEELNTEYDLEMGRRKETVSIIIDGSTAYDLDTIVTTSDVKEVTDVRFPAATDSSENEFRFIDEVTFNQHIADGVHVNEYTTYFEDGTYYIKVNSYDATSTATSMELVYRSNYNFVTNDGIFIETISNSETDRILVPRRYLNLIAYGAMIGLWSMSMGTDGELESKKSMGKFNAELKKLGLSNSATKPRRKQRRLRLHVR